MKKGILSITAVLLSVFFIACGGGEGSGSESSDDVKVSAEMTDFISGFSGDYTKVEAALAKHGGSQEIIDHDMGMYDLNNPEITAQEGDCYALVCESGMVKNTYVVCWKDGKITSIEEKM